MRDNNQFSSTAKTTPSYQNPDSAFNQAWLKKARELQLRRWQKINNKNI